MGFFPCMTFEVKRETRDGQRVIVGRFYDSVLSKWHERVCHGWTDESVEAAIAYCRKEFIRVDM